MEKLETIPLNAISIPKNHIRREQSNSPLSPELEEHFCIDRSNRSIVWFNRSL